MFVRYRRAASVVRRAWRGHGGMGTTRSGRDGMEDEQDGEEEDGRNSWKRVLWSRRAEEINGSETESNIWSEGYTP